MHRWELKFYKLLEQETFSFFLYGMYTYLFICIKEQFNKVRNRITAKTAIAAQVLVLHTVGLWPNFKFALYSQLKSWIVKRMQ